jgi:hypothetical protein
MTSRDIHGCGRGCCSRFDEHERRISAWLNKQKTKILLYNKELGLRQVNLFGYLSQEN